MGSKILNYIALTLTIIGAINWGLIGLIRFNLVSFLFGDLGFPALSTSLWESVESTC